MERRSPGTTAHEDEPPPGGMPAHVPAEWGATAAFARGTSAALETRMRVLTVLASSNQLYSGIGRAVFEFARRLTDRVAFEFAIDDAVPRNVGLLVDFCEANGFPVHVGRGCAVPDALDRLNQDLPALLREDRWAMIECVCWANTATNHALLNVLGETPLCYTPHHQPVWSVPMTEAQAERVQQVHRQVIERAELVLCDSPWERRELQTLVPDRFHCTFVPLGSSFEEFQPGPLQRREQLLFVGDLAEPRKRFDRALGLLERLRARRPGLKLVVVGNRSEEVGRRIPTALRPACELRGYLSERALRQAYAESQGLVLLSDFEAFGIPIIEALASGTPVFLTMHPPTASLFGPFRGAHFCPPGDLDLTAAIVEETLARGPDAIRETLADRNRLRATFDWERVAEQKWHAMTAAWSRCRMG